MRRHHLADEPGVTISVKCGVKNKSRFRYGNGVVRRLPEPRYGATPVGGENGGRQTVRLRGGRAGSVTQGSLVAIGASYQPVMPNRKGFWSLPLCCRTVGTSVESSGTTTAAFFDLEKTLIARTSKSARCAAAGRRRGARIVTRSLTRTIIRPLSRGTAPCWSVISRDGHDVINVSTGGQEIVGPIGAMLGARRPARPAAWRHRRHVID